MPKYYRVRSQQEWDWLADKLNIYCVKSMACPVIIEHEQGQKDYRIVQYYGGFEPVIEVSQMMEESKMEDYVTIYGKDAEQIRTTSDGQVPIVKYNKLTGRLSPIFDIADGIDIPKSLIYQKISMSETEEQELIQVHNDRFNKKPTDIRYLLNHIYNNKSFYPVLWKRMFGKDVPTTQKINKQRDVASAYFDSSLIEVIPEKRFYIKVPKTSNDFYVKSGKELTTATGKIINRQKFTEEEIKKYGLDKYKREKVSEINEKY